MPVETAPDAARYPRPNLSRDTAFYWDGLREKKLLFRRCAACGYIHHPPGPMCPSCRGLDWTVEQASGRGELFSFVIMHHPALPPFPHPNPIGLVTMEEGFRVVGGLLTLNFEEIAIGRKVALEFHQPDPELVLPMFRFVA
jgi:uncharacterized protein